MDSFHKTRKTGKTPARKENGRRENRRAAAYSAPKAAEKPSGSLKKADTAPQENRTGKTRTPAGRARHMALRPVNKDIAQKNERLREIRSDTARLEAVRLQKALAMSGVASRRAADEMIAAGEVAVNGKTAGPGSKVAPGDSVTVRGRAVKIIWPDRLPRIILYYKQEGEIVSRSDPQGRVTVFDRLPQVAGSRWVVIGRLDANTTGLLIFTTSGELANRFAHPRFAIDREYSVRVPGVLSDGQMRQLTEEGIELEDGNARAVRIREHAADSDSKNRWYDIVVQEGRNREVRRIFEYFGLTVSKLVRIRFGPVGIPPRLKRGQFYELNEVETAYVLKEMGMPLPQMKRIRK